MLTKKSASAVTWHAAIVAGLIFGLLQGPAQAWGPEGHTWINEVAAGEIPPEMPSFFRQAGKRLGYLGPEPDRWRDSRDAALNYSQAPDHFINLERIIWMTELPTDRYAFFKALYEKRATATNPDELLPERVGLQPYITIEVYERLREAFRQYRKLSAYHQETGSVEQDIVFYAGWLGHYVADGSQPLHTSISYDGWVGPNPNGYVTNKGLHWRFEGPFIADNIKPTEFAARVRAPQRLSQPFNDYVKYLRSSHDYLEKVYQLDQKQAFAGAGTLEGKQFAIERLAAGAQMLVNLWYTAWLESAEQPESHAW